jgi:hypothetical protein
MSILKRLKDYGEKSAIVWLQHNVPKLLVVMPQEVIFRFG